MDCSVQSILVRKASLSPTGALIREPYLAKVSHNKGGNGILQETLCGAVDDVPQRFQADRNHIE